MGVWMGVALGSGVGVGVAVAVGFGVGASVTAGSGVVVGVAIATGSDVGVGVAVAVGFGVGASVTAGSGVVVGVAIATGSDVGVGVAVAVGFGVGSDGSLQALRTTAMARTVKTASQRMRRVDTVISVVSPHVVLEFLSDKEGGLEFTQEDEDTLLMFASQAAMAITNARRHREEQRVRADLETLVNTCPVGVVVFDAKTGAPSSLNREGRRIVDGLRNPDQTAEELLQTLTYSS